MTESAFVGSAGSCHMLMSMFSNYANRAIRTKRGEQTCRLGPCSFQLVPFGCLRLGALLGGTVVFATKDGGPAKPLTTPVGQAAQLDSARISNVTMVNIAGSRNTQGACENPGLLEGQLEVGKPKFVGLFYLDDATCTFQVSIGTITGDVPNNMTT